MFCALSRRFTDALAFCAGPSDRLLELECQLQEARREVRDAWILAPCAAAAQAETLLMHGNASHLLVAQIQLLKLRQDAAAPDVAAKAARKRRCRSGEATKPSSGGKLRREASASASAAELEHAASLLTVQPEVTTSGLTVRVSGASACGEAPEQCDQNACAAAPTACDGADCASLKAAKRNRGLKLRGPAALSEGLKSAVSRFLASCHPGSIPQQQFFGTSGGSSRSHTAAVHKAARKAASVEMLACTPQLAACTASAGGPRCVLPRVVSLHAPCACAAPVSHAD
jgi:hypothetical protein